ncbi:3'(2'),5'-bisphosphate nucleotidase CysQ [Williamsia deligens]|uniref:3'(2'),5'-bisphosphate nucleotidase CysQ n=1 Tax=Williamsia deligens TaxID=321325 RepID=A0ABW3G6Y3_9NOCA|nr:3'(2'),5'-bisphosphate nucleotidase CysQ [Williamsia deligens]MCP2192975.1 3'(2'), 5'-bisphosphate nucleotidase [Williamsia deligens]
MTADARLAGELAAAAGELLVRLRSEDGLSGKALGAAGDEQANDLLLARLREERPDDAVLSEESSDDRRRLAADRVWIVDPLDGTREFGMPDRADWAVHVALWHAGSGLVAGAVALPDLGVTYTTDQERIDPVAGLLPERTTDRPRVVVSASRPQALADPVASAVGGDVVNLGSAGAKTMAVVRGEADVYVHSGGQYEWDSAAPVAVARAVGLWCSRVDGSPLEYNRDDVYLPDLLVCRADLKDAVLDAIS